MEINILFAAKYGRVDPRAIRHAKRFLALALWIRQQWDRGIMGRSMSPNVLVTSCYWHYRQGIRLQRNS